ncbi:MAG: sn-glycerol-3-phosphate import ATP-binding protein UgpC [Pseudomonadota bacterium]
MAEIHLDQVRKTYAGNFEAVKGISIDVADGEFLVLVGPSGCGKSTLLRMVAGLESITAGEISIGGRVVNTVEPADRDIAMVFQNYALYPHMSVYNNLAYGLKHRRTPKNEIDQRVREVARILELENYLDRKPRQLSGGQRQRVAMGRAIVRQPAAFLFDEPLSNLDAKLRVQMRIEIRTLQRNLGTTSLYVTHDQLEAMTLGDRLVVMNQGRVEQIGTPMQVYERPATVFVASFIGSPAMNLLPLQVADGRYRLARGNGLSLTMPTQTGPMTLGVRPEDFSLNGVGEGQAHADGLRLDLEVRAVEPVGHESFIHGMIGDHGPEVILRASGRSAIEPGDKLTATAPIDQLHIFDAEHGSRVAS